MPPTDCRALLPLLLASPALGCQAEPRPLSCFPGEVLVATPRGEAPINTLGTGDTVWAVDLEGGRLVAAAVAFRWDTFGAELLTLRADGHELKTTPTHRLRDAEGDRWSGRGAGDGDVIPARDQPASTQAVTVSPAERQEPPIDVHSLRPRGRTTPSSRGSWSVSSRGPRGGARRLSPRPRPGGAAPSSNRRRPASRSGSGGRPRPRRSRHSRRRAGSAPTPGSTSPRRGPRSPPRPGGGPAGRSGRGRRWFPPG